MPLKLDIEQVKAILAASDLIASWQVLIEDETAHRALYRIRCRVLRAAYQLEIRFIETETKLSILTSSSQIGPSSVGITPPIFRPYRASLITFMTKAVRSKSRL